MSSSDLWSLGFPREESHHLKILGVAIGLSWLQRVYCSVNTANVTAFIHLSYEPLVNWASTLDSLSDSSGSVVKSEASHGRSTVSEPNMRMGEINEFHYQHPCATRLSRGRLKKLNG